MYLFEYIFLYFLFKTIFVLLICFYIVKQI
jgi:hypothetical protein